MLLGSHSASRKVNLMFFFSFLFCHFYFFAMEKMFMWVFCELWGELSAVSSVDSRGFYWIWAILRSELLAMRKQRSEEKNNRNRDEKTRRAQVDLDFFRFSLRLHSFNFSVRMTWMSLLLCVMSLLMRRKRKEKAARKRPKISEEVANTRALKRLTFTQKPSKSSRCADSNL